MTTQAQALAAFIAKGEALAVELENSIASGSNVSKYCGNADVALSNLQAWLAHAKSGTLGGAYGPSGFWISKSDLMFGAAEARLYELERLYVSHLSERSGRSGTD
jgi:hypothetical protein